MSSSYNIHVPIYRFNLILVTGDTAKECEEETARLWAENNPLDPFLVHGTVDFYGRFSVIDSPHPDCRDMPFIAIVMKPNQYGKFSDKEWQEEIHMNIAHECIHAAFHILDHVGITVDGNNHEALTYLVGFLQKECIGLIFKEKAKRTAKHNPSVSKKTLATAKLAVKKVKETNNGKSCQ